MIKQHSFSSSITRLPCAFSSTKTVFKTFATINKSVQRGWQFAGINHRYSTVDEHKENYLEGLSVQPYIDHLNGLKMQLYRQIQSENLTVYEKDQLQIKLNEIETLLLDRQLCSQAFKHTLFRKLDVLSMFKSNKFDTLLEELKQALSVWNFSAAKELLQSLEQRSVFFPPFLAAIAFQRGCIAQETLNYETAYQYYLDAAKLAPGKYIYHMSAGYCAWMLGKFNHSIEHYEQALTTGVEISGKLNLDIADLRHRLSQVYRKTRQFTKALDHLELALASRLDKLDESHPDVAATWYEIGAIWSERSDGKVDRRKAITCLEKSLESDMAYFGPNHLRVACDQHELASAWSGWGDKETAIHFYEQALATRLKVLGDDHPDVSSTWYELAVIWNDRVDGRANHLMAIQYLEKALASELKVFGSSHPRIACVRHELGSAWSGRGDQARAVEFYEQAFMDRLTCLWERYRDVSNSWYEMSYFWQMKEDFDRAIACHQQVRASDFKTLWETQVDADKWDADSWFESYSGWKSKEQHDNEFVKDLHKQACQFNSLDEAAPAVADMIYQLYSLWQAEGNYSKAIPYLECAQDYYIRAYGENSHKVKSIALELTKNKKGFLN